MESILWCGVFMRMCLPSGSTILIISVTLRPWMTLIAPGTILWFSLRVVLSSKMLFLDFNARIFSPRQSLVLF